MRGATRRERMGHRPARELDPAFLLAENEWRNLWWKPTELIDDVRQTLARYRAALAKPEHEPFALQPRQARTSRRRCRVCGRQLGSTQCRRCSGQRASVLF